MTNFIFHQSFFEYYMKFKIWFHTIRIFKQMKKTTEKVEDINEKFIYNINENEKVYILLTQQYLINSAN